MMVQVQLYLVCAACGKEWRSHAASGRTCCPSCNERIYLPSKARKAAEQEPGQLVYDVATGKLQRP
jgi:DNA-directed RNA polymerase subunit RPC12/RpoP